MIPENLCSAVLSPFKEKTANKVMSDRKREYYQKNREAIISKVLERYHANIDAMHEKRKETITCDCGVVVRKDSVSKHKKTKRHLTYTDQMCLDPMYRQLTANNESIE